MVQVYLEHTSSLGNEWYAKVQLQAILFNLGIVLSVNALPFQVASAPHVSGFLQVQRDFVGEMQHAENWNKPIPVLYAQVFLRRFFAEIKQQICGGSSRKKTKIMSAATASAVAAWLVDQLGMHQAWAVGVAALILMATASAARTAFCEMTTDEFLAALDSNDTHSEG
jgi:hypothetical protein